LGTATGDLDINRGAKVSTDDSYYFVPYDPNSNTDYLPNVANQYIGLISILTDTGITYWNNAYTFSSAINVKPTDGDLSPDNQRYYMLIKITSPDTNGGILVVKISDGSVLKFMTFGDTTVEPLGLTANKLDRLAFISNVQSSSSIYFSNDNTITSDMNIIS
jgi:hypothetical protein